MPIFQTAPENQKNKKKNFLTNCVDDKCLLKTFFFIFIENKNLKSIYKRNHKVLSSTLKVIKLILKS